MIMCFTNRLRLAALILALFSGLQFAGPATVATGLEPAPAQAIAVAGKETFSYLPVIVTPRSAGKQPVDEPQFTAVSTAVRVANAATGSTEFLRAFARFYSQQGRS